VSLQISYDELRREIGRFLGYDRDPDDWESAQTTDVTDILKSGLRNFYWPNIGEQRYVWSFLRKLDTIETAADTSSYLLAADFEGGLEGFTFSSNSSRRWVSRTSELELRALLSHSYKSGVPEYCALRAVQPESGEHMRYEVLLYPVPDAVYTLAYRYAIGPSELSDSNPYHLGGAVHSECVLEACLAAAEKVMQPETQPVHLPRFQECLQASIKIDSEML